MAKDLRLQKLLAQAGLASRRKAEEYIAAGRVQVNGHPAGLGDKVDGKKDIITLDGQKVAAQQGKFYIMLHKPRGFITTMSDERERKCVADLVSDIPARLYPVGRLDKDSEGLLFMTNDGAFANTISHPSGHIPKLYRVTVRPAVTEEQVTAMSVGIMLEGVKTAPCTIRVTAEDKERSVLEIVLNEGRNRQIRKMCESLGLTVLRLKRTCIGPVKLGMLQPGKYRELTPDEIRRLTAASGKAREKNKQERKETEYDRNTAAKGPGKGREAFKQAAPSKRRGKPGSGNDRKGPGAGVRGRKSAG